MTGASVSIAGALAALERVTLGHHVRCAVADRARVPFGFSFGISADGDWGKMLGAAGLIAKAIAAGSQHVVLHRPFGESLPAGAKGAMRYGAWAETPQAVRANTEAGYHAAVRMLHDRGIVATAYLGSLQDYSAVDTDWAMAAARPAWDSAAHLAIDGSSKFVSHRHNDLLWIMRQAVSRQGRTLRIEGQPGHWNSLLCSPEPWPCCVSNRAMPVAIGQGDDARLGDVLVLRSGHPVRVNGTNWRPPEAAELAQLAIWLAAGRMTHASYCGLDFTTPVAQRRAAAAALVPALVRGEFHWWEVK